MERSFRLRLGLSSAVLAGLALGGFVAVAWWQMRAATLETIDRELRNQAERELSRPWPPDHWVQHEGNFARAFGLDNIRRSLLLAQIDGHEAFRSAHWPRKLTPDTLPWPALNDAVPGQGRGIPATARQSEGSPENDQPRPPGPWPPPQPNRDAGEFPPDRMAPAFSATTLDVEGHPWRFGLAVTPGGRLAMAIDLAVVASGMAQLERAFLLGLPFALGLIGISAWWLSGSALAPIRRIADTMETMTARGLDQRLDPAGQDREFHRLIAVFNGMLERLERGFLQATRFSADAAHELKTPLAIVQGQIERGMAECEPGSSAQAHFGAILDEVQRLGTISRKLLLLSLADAGRLRLRMSPFDLSAALTDLLEDAQMLAPELKVSADIAPNLCMQADAELFRQLLHNLLGNAIKYNRPNGWIHLSARMLADHVEIAIANASAVIPHADRDRIFERFYRVDPARERRVEGVGLGLSLSREIARAHGGDLVLAASSDGETRFVLSLPGFITKL